MIYIVSHWVIGNSMAAEGDECSEHHSEIICSWFIKKNNTEKLK